MARSINIGGEVRPIQFKMAGVRIFFEITGCNLLKEDVAKIFTEELDSKKITALVYAALYCGAYPKATFTHEDVESWLDLDAGIFTEVLLAYVDFIPKEKSPNKEAP